MATQPNVHVGDLRDAPPSILRAASDGRIQGRFGVAEVVGLVEADRLADHIRAACSRKGKTVDLDELTLSPLPGGPGRRSQLADNGTSRAEFSPGRLVPATDVP